ncbi:MAG TPA: 2-oxoglutarate dehydrogenase E1 component [Gemmatimonadaceae bacterium]|nr:2-oxoglutarate dehydrogenase E1 component [Gemmatimonadaceae bacterium]
MSSLPITSAFNDGYVAEMYDAYRRDPSSVDESWRQFFRFAESLAGTTAPTAIDESLLRKVAGAAALLGAIQRYGHLAVQLDPLGTPPLGAAELKPEFHGITESDLADIPATALADAHIGTRLTGTAADVVARMRDLYCGTIGFEFDHLEEEAERDWFRRAIEERQVTAPLTPGEKRYVLQRLTDVDGFERFLGLAFVNVKRFSIEGVDALVPMIDEAIERGARAGARSLVVGMAHRGRLNVLTHILNKPPQALFEEFLGHHGDTNSASGSGDVKYHLGYRSEREIEGVGTVELELTPNPSHLEFVNPVLQGAARAKQRVDGGAPGEREESKVLPIVVHGDAAFPGEGVVAETLNLAKLEGYRVGGTLHIIANNQVGFTTDPPQSRSTYYASDLAKGFEIPVVHVNADDAEACIQAVRLAIAYRQRFHKDFLIDVVGYRRHGHNEADQPAFTQPKLYELIKSHPSPREVWGARLVRERVVTEDDVQDMDREVADELERTFAATKNADTDEYPAAVRHEEPSLAETRETAVRSEQLVALNEQLLQWPSTFKLHPTLQRTLPRRRDAIHNGGIDWGHAEALAFASLLSDGLNVRLTGQDTERGTFSHRQAVLHDANTGERYTPLGKLPQARGTFEIYNSPLSETAVMGFEYGFSTAAPNDLVLWEAQFGDFANVAQPIVDQFLAADRAKWGQDSGLVLLLPHGYEGQGPEHSSARLERYLQLCAENNLIVAYPSSPAQYFHVLRRQAMRSPKRPLILMQPKSLLRLPAAASKLEELATGNFRPVIDDPSADRRRDDVRRLVFCSGKLYYDLIEKPRPAGIAIVRIEELYPWPQDVARIVDSYSNVEEVVWAQEEPKNMGAWTYVSPRMRADIGTMLPLRYIGRPERAAPAEGYHNSHVQEQSRIVSDVLTVPAPSGRRKAGIAR